MASLGESLRVASTRAKYETRINKLQLSLREHAVKGNSAYPWSSVISVLGTFPYAMDSPEGAKMLEILLPGTVYRSPSLHWGEATRDYGLELRKLSDNTQRLRRWWCDNGSVVIKQLQDWLNEEERRDYLLLTARTNTTELTLSGPDFLEGDARDALYRHGPLTLPDGITVVLSYGMLEVSWKAY